jgi:hypothetical protein
MCFENSPDVVEAAALLFDGHMMIRLLRPTSAPRSVRQELMRDKFTKLALAINH